MQASATPRESAVVPVRERPGRRSSLTNTLTLAAMSLGMGVVQLDITIVNTALKSIGDSLGGDVSDLQWIVNAYTITFAACILSAGALGDRFGAKRLFMAGFAIFTAASFGCAVAPASAFLILARAAQGLGAAVLVPNSLALLNHAYGDEKARGRAVGIWAAGASIALTAGPFVGGGLIEVAGWQTIFLVNIPIGLAGLWLTWRYAVETPGTAARHLDRPGQVLAVIALGVLAGAIIEAGRYGWSNMWVILGFAVAIAAAAGFIAREQRTDQPMLPLTQFASPTFSYAAAVGLIVNIAFYGLIFVFSLYFQQVNGLSPLATGLAFVPMMGAVLPTNILSARVSERFGTPVTVSLGAVIAGVGSAALLGLREGTSYWATLLQLIALGGGLGLLVPALTSTLLGSVEKQRSGIAAGVLNATRQTGSVLGVALFGAFVGPRYSFVSGVHIVLAISTVLFAAAAIGFYLGTGRR
jgi:MFS transporter, DHA2 family, methylenomycin A resistance protein